MSSFPLGNTFGNGTSRSRTLYDLRKWITLLEDMTRWDPSILPPRTVEQDLDVIKAQAALDDKTEQADRFRGSNPGKDLPPSLAKGLEKAETRLAKARDEARKRLALSVKERKMRTQRLTEANVVLEKEGPLFNKLYTDLEELGKKNAIRLSIFVPKSDEEKVKSLLEELVPLSESFRIPTEAIEAKYPM